MLLIACPRKETDVRPVPNSLLLSQDEGFRLSLCSRFSCSVNLDLGREQTFVFCSNYVLSVSATGGL
jgi:hypothetical protein